MATTPREIVQRLQLTAQKARSNVSEEDLGGEENLDRAIFLDPLCYGTHDMSIIGMTEHMLEPGMEPGPMDVFNLLTLIDLKSPSMKAMYYARWNELLPEPMDYLQSALS